MVELNSPTMARRKRSTRRRPHVKQKKQSTLSTRQRWIVGTVVLVLLGLSLMPYVMDLIRRPDVGNAVLLVLTTSAVVVLIGIVVRHH